VRFLALERPGPSDAPGSDERLRLEAIRVWELYQRGTIREAFFRADRREAVLLLEADSLRDATDALASLPLVEDGTIGFELVPLRPYDGFARLFVPLPEGRP
jgi:hypothetical protein